VLGQKLGFKMKKDPDPGEYGLVIHFGSAELTEGLANL
jgi:hypothetical protein